MSDFLPIDAVIKETGANDYSDSSLVNDQEHIGIQLLCNAATAQNLQVKRHQRMIFEVFNDERRVVFRQNSPENSAVYTFCARQKHIAKKIMQGRGVPVPAGGVFDQYESALNYFKQSGSAVTVKPSDGSSGSGVTSGVETEADFDIAWAFAGKYGRNIIVEQNVSGKDIRVIVIAGKAEAAYVREPAHVMGNGVDDIRNLVNKKNAVRNNNPSLRLDLLTRFDLLEKNGISWEYIPALGERVQLTSVANASAGGETVQIFHLLDQEVLEIAEQAARCFPGLIQVGVDLIYREGASSDASIPKVVVIEVNSNPGICDAVFPSYGHPIDIPGKLISHVFSSDAWKPRESTPLVIRLAGTYQYQGLERAFRPGVHRQVDLIIQAASLLNLEVEWVSDTVFILSNGTERCAFYGGMPEGVCMVSRKITRNREWMTEVLPASPEFDPNMSHGLHRFRLLVVGRKVVSALWLNSRNTSSEPEHVDVSDLVDRSVLPILENTLSAIFNPPIAGIDLFAEDITTCMQTQSWCVKDAVCNPNLGWHHFPGSGVGRNVALALVQDVFRHVQTEKVPRRCVRLVIRGDVQGVGFRAWLKVVAVRFCVSGWVKNLADGCVEAVLEGTPEAIAVLERMCSKGPATARVKSVDTEEMECFGRLNFAAIGRTRHVHVGNT